jgi:hypothetical protein
MLSMENCASPDGSMVGYYPNQTCASLGLNKYHWQPEPFHHLWMWLQTPAGQIIAMIAICTMAILVMNAIDRYKRDEQDSVRPG